ncbi:HAD-like protein [Linderina pennispora]|uniref:HAD-like protein n=1 Tax=Linderina pennispora TaxID=61395 RepID=A0A1Y1W4A0_9FUNG|nr:HAD-like protein [Linderina pennispora]ORX68212.1 HAD-like protein [Linderina pennispora]
MVHYSSSVNGTAADARRIRGVVFDMDGTLVTPMNGYLQQMRRELSIPNGHGIVAYVEALSKEALAHMQLSPGLVDLLRFLKASNLPVAIITRNSLASVEHFLGDVVDRSVPVSERSLFAFHPIIDRSFKPTKPSPDSLLHVARAWGVEPSELMMVGDHVDDLLCGSQAGAVAALLRYEGNGQFASAAHVVVDRIDELLVSSVDPTCYYVTA